MKISLAIPNHNQFDMIQNTIERLGTQTLQYSHLFIMSDATPVDTQGLPENIIPINNGEINSGRCGNRNSVIKPFLESGDDILVFIDGDCYPKSDLFIDEYAALATKYDLIFCMREHTPIDNIKKPASDLLTANMDQLWEHRPIDYTDLRVASGAVEAWNDTDDFAERVDLMLTGMIGWSCNFGITRKGLLKYLSFMQRTYGYSELFDSKAFRHGWGYEDVAMGIDAMYAGLNIGVTENPIVCHRSHERSDGLFDHVKGRHMIMDRYRELQARLERWHHLRERIFTIAIAGIALVAEAFLLQM